MAKTRGTKDDGRAAVDSLLQALRVQRADERRFEHAQRKRHWMQEARRRRVARRQLDRVVADGLRATGYDRTALDALHQKDDATVIRLADAEVARVHREAVHVAKRRRAKVRKATGLRKHFEYTKGNPSLTVCLWRAEAIEASVTSEIGAGTAFHDNGRIGVGQNVMEARLRSSGQGFAAIEIVHSFIWLPGQQGTVTAKGWLNFNGHYDFRVFGGCAGIFPAIQWAAADVTASLALSQQVPGAGVTRASTPFQLLLQRRIEADCNGTFDTGVVQQADEALVSLDAAVPVLANLPVAATLTSRYSVGVGELGGSGTPVAELNFTTEPEYGLNVPSIWLRFEQL